MFALGLLSWMYSRPTDVTVQWIEQRFSGKAELLDANVSAFKAGYNFGETTELFAHNYSVRPAPAEPGTYRNITGATALAWGLIAASVRSGLPIFYASYPITPASELLHELSKRKNFGVRTLQAEDEIAAAGMALGASFAGQLGVTGTSGPGLDLKQETIGLALALELPMIVVDVMRAGPSTGMPTKTEQTDLFAVLYGRHGESPMPAVAAYTPGSCFETALEAVRIAVKYRTPGRDPVRHLPGELVGAVADPRRRFAAGDRAAIRDGPEPRRRVHALRARREPRAPVGASRDARPRASDRRPGEGGRDRPHLLRPREPRAHDAAAPGEGGTHRRRHPAAGRGRPRRRRRAAGPGVGLDLRSDPNRRPARARRGQEGRDRAPDAREPPAREHRRRVRRLPQGADPGDEPGADGHDHPVPVPGGRGQLQQGPGAAHPDARAGRQRS